MILFPTADEDYQYFVSEGYNGSINDMHYQALGDIGYTGSYTDRLYSHLTLTYGDYHQALADLRSGVSTFSLLGYAVGGVEPDLVLNFAADYYRTGGVVSTFNDSLTYTGASSKTMVDSDGLVKWAPHNLVKYSEQFDNAAWPKRNTTITANAVASPDGGLTADKLVESATAADHMLGYNTGGVLTGIPSSYSVFAKAAERDILYIGDEKTKAAWFNLGTGTVGTEDAGVTGSILDVGGGWYLCTIYVPSPTSGVDNWVIGVTTTDNVHNYTGDGTSGIYIWGAHLYRSDLGGMVDNPDRGDSYVPTTSAAVYLPRRGHHIYNGSTWVNEGIQLESEARTNLLLNSGGLSTQNATVAAAPNTLSFTGTGTVTLTGTSTAGPLVGTGTGENNRVVLTFTPTAGTLTLTVSGTVTNAQLELGSTPSSYIPTAGATVTRAAETLLAPNAVIGDYQTKGSALFIGNAVDPSIDTNAAFLTLYGPGNDFYLRSVTANQAQASLPNNVVSIGVPGLSAGSFKAAAWYDTSLPGVSISLNGAAAESDLVGSTGDLGAGFDLQFMTATVNQYNTIKQVSFWPGVVIGDTGIATASARTYTTEFAMIVATTTPSETFTIPCRNVGTFNAGIDWGDGQVSTITAYNDAALTHTYATAGDHVIRITGTFPNIYFNNGGDKLKVKSVENLGEVGWTRLDEAFFGCTNLTSFTAGTTDTSAVTDMSSMFYSCTSLATLDISGFNTALVTSMTSMFRGCTSLTTLDVSSFNTALVTNMTSMFQSCSSVTALDVSSFNTALVTSMTNMFYGCSSVTALDVSGLNTALVTNMSNMFRDCTNVTALDVSGFNTALVTNMTSMFRNCTSLTTLDVSSFNTALVTTMSSMFSGCSSLTTLDVSGFDTALVNTMGSMFYGCSSVTALDVSNFNTALATSMGNMFYTCSSVTALDVSNFNTALVTDITAMFRGCSSVTALDVSSFNTALVTNMSSMLRNCTSLTDIVGVDTFDIGGLNATTSLNAFATNATLPTARYDALLLAWEAQDPFDGMSPDFGSSTYTGGGAVATAHASLISRDGWTITDGGIA